MPRSASTSVLREPDQLHLAQGRPAPGQGVAPGVPGPGQVSGDGVLWFSARLLRCSFGAILPVPPLQQLGVGFRFGGEVNGAAESVKNAAVHVLAYLPAELRIKQLGISTAQVRDLANAE